MAYNNTNIGPSVKKERWSSEKAERHIEEREMKRNHQTNSSSTSIQRFCPMADNSSNGSSSPIITRIPPDHLFSILLLLPVESILAFAMTCKKLKSLSNSESLWESICRRDWGQTPVDALKKGSSSSSSNRVHQLQWKKLYQQVCRLDSVYCRRLLADDAGDSVPSPRASHSLNLVSRFLVLFGGGCEGGRHLEDTWIAPIDNDFRTTTLKWQKISSGIPSGRFGHTCVVIGDSLVLFGGINDHGARLNDTWIGQVVFHETRGTIISWRSLDIALLPPPRGAHAGCSIDGKKSMLVHGGIGPSGTRLGDTWVLDLSEDLYSGSWREIVAPQPHPPSRSGHTLTHIGGSQTILFGGRGTGYEVLNDVWLLEASAGDWRWAQVPFELRNIPRGMSLPRVGHSANLITGRRLLIYGGEDSERRRKDDLWVLDIGLIPHVRATQSGISPSRDARAFREIWKRLESKGDKPKSRSFHGACVDGSGCCLYVYGGMVDGVIQPADSSGLRFDGESFVLELVLQP